MARLLARCHGVTPVVCSIFQSDSHDASLEMLIWLICQDQSVDFGFCSSCDPCHSSGVAGFM